MSSDRMVTELPRPGRTALVAPTGSYTKQALNANNRDLQGEW